MKSNRKRQFFSQSQHNLHHYKLGKKLPIFFIFFLHFFHFFFIFFLSDRLRAVGPRLAVWTENIVQHVKMCAPTSRVRFCPLPVTQPSLFGVTSIKLNQDPLGSRSQFNPCSTQTIPWLGSPSGPRSRSPSLTRSFMTLSVSTLSSFPR